ncbi:MAG: hypothetical protein QXP28_01730 [Archaeoglobaceae archaeon]
MEKLKAEKERRVAFERLQMKHKLHFLLKELKTPWRAIYSFSELFDDEELKSRKTVGKIEAVLKKLDLAWAESEKIE